MSEQGVPWAANESHVERMSAATPSLVWLSKPSSIGASAHAAPGVEDQRELEAMAGTERGAERCPVEPVHPDGRTGSGGVGGEAARRPHERGVGHGLSQRVDRAASTSTPPVGGGAAVGGRAQGAVGVGARRAVGLGLAGDDGSCFVPVGADHDGDAALGGAVRGGVEEGLRIGEIIDHGEERRFHPAQLGGAPSERTTGIQQPAGFDGLQAGDDARVGKVVDAEQLRYCCVHADASFRE
jgi:hypothetical protein